MIYNIEQKHIQIIKTGLSIMKAFGGEESKEFIDETFITLIKTIKEHEEKLNECLNYLNKLNAEGKLDYSSYYELFNLISDLKIKKEK